MLGSVSGQSQKQPEGTLELLTDEAFILVKAAPRRSNKFGETVCCAGIDRYGNWVRLYPVAFRYLDGPQKFKRWDHIRYRWSKPKASNDVRSESRRVDPNSIEVLHPLKQSARNPLVARCAVTSLDGELKAGRSLALLKADIIDFWYERNSEAVMKERDDVLAQLRAQSDFFAPATSAIPLRSCPYSFKYRYRCEDGEREGTCQDWETEQTFFRQLHEQATEQAALDWMVEKFGVEYPQKGMALAMGTHRRWKDQWLINGVIRLNDEPQLGLL
jgi:hypothetical protein